MQHLFQRPSNAPGEVTLKTGYPRTRHMTYRPRKNMGKENRLFHGSSHIFGPDAPIFMNRTKSNERATR